jgi:hypothetical protein
VLGTLAASGEFALSNDLCSGQTLTPTGTCTFDVAFSPLSLGAKNGSISVPSNAASSPDILPLSGSGWEWTKPMVSSMKRLDATPTGALNIRFNVTFSESVTGVDLSDFALSSGVTNTSISSVSGSGKTYTVTVNTGNGNGYIRLDVIDDDSIKDSYNNSLGGTGGSENGNYYGYYAIYNIRTIPTLGTPSGTIGGGIPEFNWNKLTGATKYKYEIRKGAVVIYSKIISSAKCITRCKDIPSIPYFNNGNYKWRVTAFIDGKWRGYSNYMPFEVSAPLAGFWKGGPNYSEFYITPDRGYIDNFSIYVTVYACNIYNQKFTYTSLVPLIYSRSLSRSDFRHSGTYYFSGYSKSTTTAYSSFGMYGYYWPGCGYLYGGPFPSNPAWVNNTKPTTSGAEVFEFTVSPLPKDLMIPPTIFDLFNP